jgi:D-serine deaminase-like pyridoxal phosphate-dependent protein
MLRILPNHACATSAWFDGDQLLTTSGGLDFRPRFRGW